MSNLAKLRANALGHLTSRKFRYPVCLDPEKRTELRKLALVYLFQWYGLACYWQFVAASLAKSIWGTSDETSDAFKEAVGWTGLVNGWYNIVTFSVAFALVAGLLFQIFRPAPKLEHADEKILSSLADEAA